MNIRDIVFATDFSEASEATGRVAREMALEMGARLQIVHVTLPGADPGAGAAALTEAARRLGSGVSVETALLSGRPAREIVRFAADKHVGVIVIGTHGRTGASRQLLGSVAEAVVRLAPCLVMTVPIGFSLAGIAAVWTEPPPSAIHRCVVCAGVTDDLICETCRIRIRGQALERKIETERAGRRGAPA
jgi:nucleotide-binding universal stress UspA family protein